MNSNNKLNNQEYIQWVIQTFLPNWFEKIYNKSMGNINSKFEYIEPKDEKEKELKEEWLLKRKQEWIDCFFICMPDIHLYLFKPIFLIDSSLTFFIPFEIAIQIRKCIVPLINISKSHNDCVKEIYQVLNIFLTFLFQQIPFLNKNENENENNITSFVEDEIKNILKQLMPMHCFIERFNCKDHPFFFIQNRAIWLKTKIDPIGFIYFSLVPKNIYNHSSHEYIPLNTDEYLLEKKIEGDNLDTPLIKKLIEEEDSSEDNDEMNDDE